MISRSVKQGKTIMTLDAIEKNYFFFTDTGYKMRLARVFAALGTYGYGRTARQFYRDAPAHLKRKPKLLVTLSHFFARPSTGDSQRFLNYRHSRSAAGFLIYLIRASKSSKIGSLDLQKKSIKWIDIHRWSVRLMFQNVKINSRLGIYRDPVFINVG